jgi:hypothetical protein
MKIKRNIFSRIMIDISCLIAICLFLIIWQLTKSVGLAEQLEKELTGNERLIDYTVEGGIAYTFVSTTGSSYGDRLLVFTRNESGEWNRNYENDFSGLKPWRLRLADIDGDNEKELLTAVRKTTFYDKEEKNRLFVFNYTDGLLVKKWTGSEIAGSWGEFITGELVNTKGEEVIFISKTKDGQERLLIYHWFDFGFLMLAQSADYQDIIEVVIIKENRIRITYNDGQKKTELFMLKDGTVTKVD